MEPASFGHHISFTMNGVRYRIPSKNHLTSDEFTPMLYYTRRLLGYVIYPRWFISRLFLAEVIEMLKKNGLYKHELKKQIGNIIQEFNILEQWHKQDFNMEFLEVVAGNLTSNAMKKLNDFRGSVGGVLLQQGIKKYLLYSYPYTLLNLCYNNLCTYGQAMRQVQIKYGVDFTNVFLPLRGDRVYLMIVRMMGRFVRIMGEPINHITFKGSHCREKLEAMGNILLNNDLLREAFEDAFEEVPLEQREEVEAEMNIWLDDEEDLKKKLSEKYNVKELK